MAHINKVMKSINQPGENVCVDIFVRPTGTYGFEECRRDTEDGRGWYIIGFHGDREFVTAYEATNAALAAVPWLAGAPK